MSDYPNSGIISRNKFKRAGSKQPDATGKCSVTLGGKEYSLEIIGWLHEGRKGRFTALRFEESHLAEARRMKAKAEKAGLPTESAHGTEPEKDSQIPF